MDLVQVIELRKAVEQQIINLVAAGEAENRSLTAEENQTLTTLKGELQGLDEQITEINNRNNTNKNMENTNSFKDLIVRNADGTIQNMLVEARALGLSTSVDNVTVAGDIASVGYKPFWQSMGVNYMPNLSASIKLPYIGNVKGKKVAEGEANANDKTPAVITLQPARYTVTETVGKELMAVGNEQALQAFLQEMVKGVDKAITEDVYNITEAGAVAVTGLTGYTTSNIDTIVAGVDGNVTLLMPRAEFYKAKGVKADTGSGKFLAEKTGEYTGNMWDGTPLFYSNLFSGNTVVGADLNYVTVATFLNEGKEIEISYLPIPSKGQVEITVCKLANVALRSADAAKKAVIA